MFERIPTQLPDVVVLKPRIFRDQRGLFAETYRANQFAELGIADRFVQDNHSRSAKGALRGLHYQLRQPQAKLCRVVSGEVLDIAVDIRRGSPTFGKYASAVLSAENMHQIYVPVGFAHGFVVLSDTAEFLYKCSDYYDPGGEYGVLWSDPALGIDWGAAEPILSEKDSKYPRLAEISQEFLPVYRAK
jgi:dTDP-4-dehydrorhamnose 3,5-epimerase